jgi:hypothetical protein
MSATLTIQVSDALLEQLRLRAAREGKTPEALASECLNQLLPLPPGGFLTRWAGAFASGVPDASLRHDELLGQALYDELHEKPHD